MTTASDEDFPAFVTLGGKLAKIRRLQDIHKAYMDDPRIKTDKQLNSEARHVAASIAEAKKEARKVFDGILTSRKRG